jgi:hypothetical protein
MFGVVHLMSPAGGHSRRSSSAAKLAFVGEQSRDGRRVAVPAEQCKNVVARSETLNGRKSAPSASAWKVQLARAQGQRVRPLFVFPLFVFLSLLELIATPILPDRFVMLSSTSTCPLSSTPQPVHGCKTGVLASCPADFANGKITIDRVLNATRLLSISFLTIWLTATVGSAQVKTEIPVTYLGDLNLDNTPPTVIECTKGQDAVDRLTAAIAAARPAPSMHELSQAAKERGVTIDEVMKSPSQYVHWSREQWEKSLRGAGLDALVSRLVSLLDDETTEIGNRSQFAQILSKLGDRRGFDWSLKRLKISDTADYAGVGGDLVNLYLAGFEHREWLAGVDLWPLIEPRLNSPGNYESVGRELCPGEMSEWYLRQMRRTDLPESMRISYLATLSGYAPSVEALDACADLFVKPGADSEWSDTRRFAEIFTRFASGGDIFRCSHPNTLLRDWFEANPLSVEKLAAIRARVCQYVVCRVGRYERS